MITNDQLAAGAVTATKLSKNLRLPHVNLVKASMGDVLVAAPNGDFVAKQLKGAVLMEDTGIMALEPGHLYKQLKKLGVVFKEDFTRPNSMLYAKRAGQPEALDLNELQIQLGIPNTFSSAELDVAYTGTGGGGGLVKIKSFTDSAGANPFIIDGFSDAFDSYKLVCHDVLSTGGSTSDLGVRMVYGTTVISTDSYRYQNDETDNDNETWHSTSDGTQYGFSTVCIENTEPAAFDFNFYHLRNTAATGVFVVGHGISFHDYDASTHDIINSYRFYGGMRWAGGIATADRKVDAIYLYPLTASAVEAAGAAKIKGKFTLYGFKK